MLKEILNYVRQGDSLVITTLDRLARSIYHLIHIAEELKNMGVDLVVLDQDIDTSTPTGKLFLICWHRSQSSKQKSVRKGRSGPLK